MFDSSQTMCAWTDPSLLPVQIGEDDENSVFSCNYMEPDMSWKVLHFVRSSTNFYLPIQSVRIICRRWLSFVSSLASCHVPLEWLLTGCLKGKLTFDYTPVLHVSIQIYDSWILRLFSFILAPLAVEECEGAASKDDAKPIEIVAEKDTATGKVSQCHIDRPPATNPVMRALTNGGLAVISIPHRLMRAKLVAATAVGSVFSEKWRDDVESPQLRSSSDVYNIASGTPRSMRSLNQISARSFFPESQSVDAVVPVALMERNGSRAADTSDWENDSRANLESLLCRQLLQMEDEKSKQNFEDRWE
jgi:hypothetical protein